MTHENPKSQISSGKGTGDPDEQFIREFTQVQRPLFLYLLPLTGNAVDAEEVLQETNLVIWKKREQYQPGTSFLAWGRTIARLEYFRFRRRNQRVRLMNEGVLELIAEEAEVLSDQAELRRQALAICVDQLRPKDRQLLQMRYAPGANGDRVATELGRPANSVYQSLGRIRRVLMECIQHRLTDWQLHEDTGLQA
ncbi:MAG: sigma-70 family RNA polymerase sigma factor [Planctomycetaceae bacterium]